MPLLTVSEKTLKLSNVLIAELITPDMDDFTFVEKIDNYIKSKGYQPIGPVIQYTGIDRNDNDDDELVIKLCRQSTGFINHVESPFSMLSTLRVPKCLYTRFIGPQDRISIAYSKLNVYAYENEISLLGSSFTIIIDQLDNDNIVADVFMEKADE